MIQLNLLPAIKLEYVKARKIKRLTMMVSSAIALLALGIMILLAINVLIMQKNHSANLTKDIKSESSKITTTENINKILTIQNQLNNINSLHAQKPVAEKLFEYLSQTTPESVSIASLKIDFEAMTLEIIGSANKLSDVNTYVDTLKFTDYRLEKLNADNKKETTISRSFSGVVLANYGRDEKGVSYEVSFKFDPVIFSSENIIVSLVVPPGKITTRSQVEKPSELFQELRKEDE